MTVARPPDFVTAIGPTVPVAVAAARPIHARSAIMATMSAADWHLWATAIAIAVPASARGNAASADISARTASATPAFTVKSP